MSNQARVAIVTGAAQGIGRAIALRFASDGIDVAVNDIPSKLTLLNEVVREITGMGRRALTMVGDVSNESNVEEMVDKVVKEFGRLDIMVANAGLGQRSTPIVDADLEYWERIFAVNIRGVILCYKYAARQMVKQGHGGRIIGASSITGKKGFADLAPYCMSKFAVRGLTQCVALEMGQHGITVNAYAPGIIDTPMVADESDKDLGPASAAKQIMATPHAIVGQPSDIASLVSYLASPEAHFITGQTVIADGGIIFD